MTSDTACLPVSSTTWHRIGSNWHTRRDRVWVQAWVIEHPANVSDGSIATEACGFGAS